MDTFYVNGYAMDNKFVEYGPKKSFKWINFDLIDYCENLFDEFVFSRSFVATVFCCLGNFSL